jgi:hypothetical protein
MPSRGRHLSALLKVERLPLVFFCCLGFCYSLGLGVESQAAMHSLSMTFRICGSCLNGIGRELAVGAAADDLQAQDAGAMTHRIRAAPAGLPALASSSSAENVVPSTRQRLVQPSAYRRDAGMCTPTLMESSAVAAGQELNLNTLTCQIRFNLTPE